MRVRLATALVNLTNEVSETNAKLALKLEAEHLGQAAYDDQGIVEWLEGRLDSIAQTAEAERARLERLLEQLSGSPTDGTLASGRERSSG